MKVAIMQPYLFPYIGYWQLVNAVDRFVLLDDVNYIVRGYINRNSILINGEPHKFTIPIQKASQNRLIKDTKLNFQETDKKKFIAMLENAYKKALHYQDVMPLIKKIVFQEEEDLTSYIYISIKEISAYLNISTDIYRSSRIPKDISLKAQERIIEICKKMRADVYINPCGGRELYVHERFEEEGIQLFFLDTRGENITYWQGTEEFKPNLSIIDVMMFNDVTTVKGFLNQYDLNQ